MISRPASSSQYSTSSEFKKYHHNSHDLLKAPTHQQFLDHEYLVVASGWCLVSHTFTWSRWRRSFDSVMLFIKTRLSVSPIPFYMSQVGAEEWGFSYLLKTPFGRYASHPPLAVRFILPCVCLFGSSLLHLVSSCLNKARGWEIQCNM